MYNETWLYIPTHEETESNIKVVVFFMRESMKVRAFPSVPVKVFHLIVISSNRFLLRVYYFI